MPESFKNDALIVRLLQNDATADKGFKLLVESYSQRLYWHIRSIVKNHHDANDVVQNTFIKIFKGIKSFKAESKLYTWLYRIATNESLTFLKRKKSTSSMDDGALQIKIAPSFHDENDTIEKLKNALELLPEKQKLVFNLRYYEEMTYQDISEITGTSIGGLKASYHHAVKKLKKHLTNKSIL